MWQKPCFHLRVKRILWRFAIKTQEEEEEIRIKCIFIKRIDCASFIDRRWYKQRTIALAVIKHRSSSGNEISGRPGNRQNWQIDARVVVSDYIFIFFRRWDWGIFRSPHQSRRICCCCCYQTCCSAVIRVQCLLPNLTYWANVFPSPSSTLFFLSHKPKATSSVINK